MSDKTNSGIGLIKDMLKVMFIEFDTLDDLEGKVIERDVLLMENVSKHLLSFQDKIKESGYKTGTLTSLHKNNNSKQKWPEVNILRQLLKCNGIKLRPFTKSNGYDKKTGKKNVIRYYRFEKLEEKN